MPIFGLSCIASSCHDTTMRKANLVLGDPSACGPMGTSCYDPNAKWKYSFKQPVPQDLLATVYANLVNAPTATVPAVMRVSPGAPGASFLVDSVMATQNSRWYSSQCQSQDPTRPGICGSGMPLGSPSLCAESPDKVQAIAMWIQQGAENN